jgi:hypothetical protein
MTSEGWWFIGGMVYALGSMIFVAWADSKWGDK